MIRKFHESKINDNIPVTLWGSGTPLREFLYVVDLANTVLFALSKNLDEHLYNVGPGEEISIKDLALMIRSITSHEGEIIRDTTKPDGTPRKLLDTSKLRNKEWYPKTDLTKGIQRTYQVYKKYPKPFN